MHMEDSQKQAVPRMRATLRPNSNTCLIFLCSTWTHPYNISKRLCKYPQHHFQYATTISPENRY